jgi:acyl carrier protein
LTKEEILQGLTEIFRDVFDREDLVITPRTTAADIPEWDSFNHINLIVASEMTFKVKFQVAETEELKNVGELIDLIATKQAR